MNQLEGKCRVGGLLGLDVGRWKEGEWRALVVIVWDGDV